MPTDLPRFESNERVDLTDLDYSVDDALQAMVRQVNEQFLTDPDGSIKSWILDGFAMSDLGAGQLSVAKGRGVLAQREGAEIHYGALTTEGDTTKTLDLSGYGNSTDYRVFIRFQYVDAETQSRMFWNPSGPTEFAQSIQTRRQANWSLRVELASPGDEWVRIGTVDMVGGAINAITDERNFYFEGVVNTSYPNTWGSANDRTATRSGQYGIKDLQQFTAAVRQLFEDLRPTGGRWWEVRGLKATGLAASGEPGFEGLGDLAGSGIKGIGGATNGSSGLFGDGANSAAANSNGATTTGKGTGYGAKGTGGATGSGLEGVGGATSGTGVKGTGTNGNALGVEGIGQGSAAGVKGIGGATNGSSGVLGDGANSAAVNSNGTTGTGKGTGYGAKGTGGGTAGVGVEGVGGATGGKGVVGTGGDTSGRGGDFIGGAPNGIGAVVSGTGTGIGVSAVGGATSGTGGNFLGGAPNGHGVVTDGDGTGEGIVSTGGATSGSGGNFIGGAPNGVGVNATGVGTGASLGFNKYLEGTEMTAPAVGAANTARIFVEDAGGGKTKLMVIFQTGVGVQLAVEV